MTKPNHVTALLMVLDQQLMTASYIARCAHEAAQKGEMNLAIGTLLPAQQRIDEASALFRVILSLHRDARETAAAGGVQ